MKYNRIMKLFIKVSFNIFLVLMVNFALAAKIPLFVPTLSVDSKQEMELKSQLEKQGLDIVLLNKFKDFNEYLLKNQPPLVVSYANLKYTNRKYIPKLRILNKKGKESFNYGLYSETKKKIKQNKMYKIGMLQTTPLKQIFRYAKSIMPISIKRVKTVPKEEDIISLLLFEIVDFIVLRTDHAKALETELEIKLNKIAESKPIFELTVYARKGLKENKNLKILSKLNKATLQILGGAKMKWLR